MTPPTSVVTSAISPDGDWIAISGIADGVPVDLIEGWDVTVSIDGTEIGGTAACNGYGGRVDVGATGTFDVAELVWTEMGCEGPVQALEQAFLASLGTVTHYSVADDVLTLSSDVDEWVFERRVAIDDAFIVGTTWVLDTVIQGDVATNSSLMSLADLTLHDDGTLSGSTSCRQMEGEWVRSGPDVVFTSFAVIEDPTAGQCSEESVDLENIIVSVLGDGFAPSVDGNRLAVTGSGGEGLSYVAS